MNLSCNAEEDGGFYETPHQAEYTGVRTTRCVSARQIADMSVNDASSILQIDRAEVSNVVLCGYVKDVRTVSVGVAFRVFDTTGEVDCTYWTGGAFEEGVSSGIREKMCVRVLGSLRSVGGKKSVSVGSLCEVGVDAVLYHLTKVIYEHLHHIGKLQREGRHEEGLSGQSKIQRDVLEVYRNNQGDEGLELEVAIRMLSGRYPESEIRRVIDELLADCHLYWVSDTTYKTTV